ncbi:MAG: XVIPCD domain-containing protein, partial [Lysobacteraceae bacterium]
TKLRFNEDYSLNGDWTRTAAGQLYGADGMFKLGKEGNGTANFRVDEPADTAAFNTKLKFNEDYSLNGDWTRTAAGQLYGADGTFKLGKEGNGTAAFRIDEPNGTSLFNTKLKFDESTLFNADFSNTKNGSIYGADATFGFGNGDKGTAGFRVDEPANTSSIKTKLEFANGSLLNFDLEKSPNGSVYGADGAFGLGQNGKGLAGFRIDEPNQSSNYKLGASFDNGTAFNAQLMKDRLGTSFGLDGKFDFDKGAGSVMLDGKFGPRLDMGASVNYKNENLEYSGHIRANNEFGPFKVSEFGAKVSTAGNERYKFSAEAGYRPENNEYYGRVGITIQLGGGHSRPSRPITRAESGFDSERSIDDAASMFKEKQSTLLRPENKGLYDQAVSGVEKLNASGAKLPVGETAASLTVLAKENGMQNIQYVALGNPTSGGQQNLFIGDGDPGNPAAKKAFIDRAQAATTPMQDSLQKIGSAPAQNDSPALDQPQLSAQKRSAM